MQACTAALWMFSEAAAGPAGAQACLHRARQAGEPCTERERQFIEAVTAWVGGDVLAALAGFEAIVTHHPRDLASLKLGQYLAFNLGDSPRMLKLALKSLPAAGDVAALHGMLAFAWEQCHLLA